MVTGRLPSSKSLTTPPPRAVVNAIATTPKASMFLRDDEITPVMLSAIMPIRNMIVKIKGPDIPTWYIIISKS